MWGPLKFSFLMLVSLSVVSSQNSHGEDCYQTWLLKLIGENCAVGRIEVRPKNYTLSDTTFQQAQFEPKGIVPLKSVMSSYTQLLGDDDPSDLINKIFLDQCKNDTTLMQLLTATENLYIATLYLQSEAKQLNSSKLVLELYTSLYQNLTVWVNQTAGRLLLQLIDLEKEYDKYSDQLDTIRGELDAVVEAAQKDLDEIKRILFSYKPNSTSVYPDDAPILPFDEESLLQTHSILDRLESF